MKKNVVTISVLALGLFFASCNADDNPAGIAKKWCDLNGKVARADNPAAKEKAEENRKKYEQSIEEKYKGDTTMMRKIGEEVEKCEDESEGRK
jgi:hypothetical protein